MCGRRIGVARIDEAGLLALEAAPRRPRRCRRRSPGSGTSPPTSRRSCERVVPPWTSGSRAARVLLVVAFIDRRASEQQKNRPRIAASRSWTRPVRIGPLATCLTWLQADRPNHHGIRLAFRPADAAWRQSVQLRMACNGVAGRTSERTVEVSATCTGILPDRAIADAVRGAAPCGSRAARRRPDPAGQPRPAARPSGLPRARQLPAGPRPHRRGQARAALRCTRST